MLEEDLAEEQAYIDRAQLQLDRMRARSEQLLQSMQGTDPDLEWALLRRVRALQPSRRALCFGRLDGADGTWYVGRRHVEDEDAEPVVVEWRAPVALPYYRASRRDPMGLRRRRQFVVDGRRLLSIGDDVFDGSADTTGDRLRGGEALLMELDRARTGEMLDIVATIQPEQDEIIRSDPAGILAVQGGPGSGKTAVGLHRAAFLLYGDDDLARQNVLVVGPNRTFLRYIAQVLPALGEQAVVQTTFLDLVPEIDSRRAGADPAATRRIKGDGRMAAVLARAVAGRRSSAAEDLGVPIGARTLTLPAETVNRTVERVAAAALPYASGREVLRRQLIDQLADRYQELTGRIVADSREFEAGVRSSPQFKEALDRRWPSVSATTVVSELLSRPGMLEAASAGILDDAERRALRRRRGRSWTGADAPLLDEAKAQIAGQSRTYGYAIVDEAQDLSPMELRMLSRRCPSGNMTLLGDLAQAIGVWGHRDWSAVAEWLPAGSSFRTAELRFGYRSPAQVLDLASRLLPSAAPGVIPTEAVRPGRTAPRIEDVEPAQLLEAVVGEAMRLRKEWATVAVITPAPLRTQVVEALRSRMDGVGDAEVEGLARPVTVVEAQGAKGLEFDAVLVVEPGGIVSEMADHRTGLRLLYVALTRPTQHLSIVTTSPLPAPLGAGAQSIQ